MTEREKYQKPFLDARREAEGVLVEIEKAREQEQLLTLVEAKRVQRILDEGKLKRKGRKTMTFEEWMKRPVYVTQCKTAEKAKNIGLPIPKLRILPSSRDSASRTVRDALARVIRADRQTDAGERCYNV